MNREDWRRHDAWPVAWHRRPLCLLPHLLAVLVSLWRKPLSGLSLAWLLATATYILTAESTTEKDKQHHEVSTRNKAVPLEDWCSLHDLIERFVFLYHYSRKYLIGGNWKCNGTLAENKDRIKVFNEAGAIPENVEVALCVPYIHIPMVVADVRKDITVGAQNCGNNDGDGAFTGEVSAGQVRSLWLLTLFWRIVPF